MSEQGTNEAGDCGVEGTTARRSPARTRLTASLDRRLESVLASAYARLGPRLIILVMASGIVVTLLTGAVGVAFWARYLNFSPSQASRVYIIWVPLLIALAMLAVIPARRQLRTILSWSGTARTPGNAAETWQAIMHLRQVVTRGLVIGGFGVPVGALYTVSHYHKPWYGLVVISLAPLITACGAWALIVFGAEFLMRPMLEDVASRLPSGFEPPVRGMTLRMKAIIPVPIITLIAALLVGAYANLSSNGTLRFTLALGVALGTVAVATAIYLIVARSVLAPVNDLILATRQVRAGKLDTRVPIVTDDELGELTSSFNSMLRELQSRTDDLRASRERIVAAADEERRRVERDLHDGAQQHLVLIGLKLAVMERLVGPDPKAAALARELHSEVECALAELRDLAHGLYPPVLRSDGLPGALRDAVARSATPATLDCDGAGRYGEDVEAAVYFCCLEALQNVAKHAGEEAHAEVRLSEMSDTLRFEVADDGIGFDPAQTGASSGLQNMIDRIGALGGKLIVTSARDRGTTVAGTIPVGSGEAPRVFSARGDDQHSATRVV
jgi:signal transduction histidine kinase